MCFDHETFPQILVRSYLSDLQAPSRRSSPLSPGPGPRLEPLPRVLLDEGRRPFLDLMPPFAPDLAERLASPSTSPTASPTVASPAGPQGPPAAKLLSLRKLQVGLSASPRRLAAPDARGSGRSPVVPVPEGRSCLELLCCSLCGVRSHPSVQPGRTERFNRAVHGAGWGLAAFLQPGQV